MCRELRDVLMEAFESLQLPPHLKLGVRSSSWEKATFFVFEEINGHSIAGWTILRAPGLIVVSNAYVSANYQGQGWGKKLAQFRVDCFKKLREDDGWGNPCEEIEMICRVAPENFKQKHILAEVGWEPIGGSATLWRVKE